MPMVAANSCSSARLTSLTRWHQRRPRHHQSGSSTRIAIVVGWHGWNSCCERSGGRPSGTAGRCEVRGGPSRSAPGPLPRPQRHYHTVTHLAAVLGTAEDLMRQVAVTDPRRCAWRCSSTTPCTTRARTRTRPTARRWPAPSCPSSRSPRAGGRRRRPRPGHTAPGADAGNHRPGTETSDRGTAEGLAPTTQRSSSTRTSPSWPPSRRATRPAPRASGPSTHTSTTRPGAPDGDGAARLPRASRHLPHRHRCNVRSTGPAPTWPRSCRASPRLIPVRLRRAGAPWCGRRRCGRTLRRACAAIVAVTTPSAATWAVWMSTGSAGSGPTGAGGSQRGGGELPPPGQRAALERWEHEHRLVQVPTGYHLRHLPAQARVSRWRRLRASVHPHGHLLLPRVVRQVLASRTQRGQGLTRPAHRDDGSVGGELPARPTPRTGPAPEREQLEEGPPRRGDGGQRHLVVPERAQVQHRRPVVDGEPPGCPPGRARATRNRMPPMMATIRPPMAKATPTPSRRQAEQVRPAELRQRRLQQEVADALERVAHADAEDGQGDDADQRAGRPGKDERRAAALRAEGAELLARHHDVKPRPPARPSTATATPRQAKSPAREITITLSAMSCAATTTMPRRRRSDAPASSETTPAGAATQRRRPADRPTGAVSRRGRDPRRPMPAPPP